MAKTLPQAVFLGLVGALMFVALMFIPVLGSMIQVLSAAPLMVAGLRWGLLGTIVAGGAGIVAVTLVAPASLLSVSLFGLDVLPALVVAALALRPAPGRPAPPAPGDGPEAWFPPGHILAVLAGFGALLAAAGLLALPSGEESIRDTMTALVGTVMDVLLAEAPPELKAQVMEQLPAYLPGTFMAFWVVRASLCAVLAQWWVARRPGGRRPTPNYRQLTLPVWAVGAFVAIGAAGVILPGDGGYVAMNGAFALAMPLVFMGLVLVHAAARSLPHPGVALVGFYGLFVLGSTTAVIAVAGLGIAEFFIRRRTPQGSV